MNKQITLTIHTDELELDENIINRTFDEVDYEVDDKTIVINNVGGTIFEG